MAHTANSTTAMADNKLPFDEKPEDLPNSCNMELERSSGTITSIPDEVITHNNRRKFQFGRVQSLFNGHHPPVSIFGISRKKLIVIAMAIIISLLALILGLSIGLTHHKAQAKPFPSLTERHSGQLTYYDPGLGACGISSGPGELVAALPRSIFDAASTSSNPNMNPLCGRTVRAGRVDERTGQYASVDVKIVDRCVGCAANDLDVSPAAFQAVANPDLGRVNVQWAFL